jgi:hypothetical protein
MLMFSCGKKKSISGKEFIPHDSLVQILTELHLMDGVTNDTRFYHKFNPGDSVDMYTWIFEKHSITKEKYELTIKEYSKYPELLDQIYDEVLMQLTLKLEKEEKVTDEDRNPKLSPGKNGGRKELPSNKQ